MVLMTMLLIPMLMFMMMTMPRSASPRAQNSRCGTVNVFYYILLLTRSHGRCCRCGCLTDIELRNAATGFRGEEEHRRQSQA